MQEETELPGDLLSEKRLSKGNKEKGQEDMTNYADEIKRAVTMRES